MEANQSIFKHGITIAARFLKQRWLLDNQRPHNILERERVELVEATASSGKGRSVVA
jgi:hypothetical protein